MPVASRYHRAANNVFVPNGAPPFTYSDGDAEEEYIAKVIAETSDCGSLSQELEKHMVNWSSFYHLTHTRTYLLRPLRHLLEGKSVLELGAGCGALTRYIGETAKSVVALEGSPRRAAIIASRCRDLNTVTVVNDAIQDLETTEKFDVVTLIGVLEYARKHGPKSDNPEAAMLAIAKSFLKPGGRLLLAIENQLGLKYFAGAREDHLCVPFFGIHDLYSKHTPVTFGKKELCALLENTGFASIEQVVPLPDYKFPITMLLPACFDDKKTAIDVTPLIQNSYRTDRQRPSGYCFSLEAATSAMVRNGLVTDLCNSLFFIAGTDTSAPAFDENYCAAHYGTSRAIEYVKETVFIRHKNTIKVQKRYLDESMPRTSQNIINIIEDETYLPYPLYHDELVKRINTPGWTVKSIAHWAGAWVDFLRENATENLELPGIFLDATPLNCVITDSGKVFFFDQEWSFSENSTIPLPFVVFRGLCQSISWFTSVAPPAKQTPTRLWELAVMVMKHLDLPATQNDVEEFKVLAQRFVLRATKQRQNRKFFDNELPVRLLA